MRRSPAELLAAWRTFTHVGEAGKAAGFETIILQAADEDAVVTHNGVECHFIREFSELASRARALQPDIVHVRGLSFPAQTRALQRVLSGARFVLQNHSDRVPRWWRRATYRRAYRDMAGIVCTAKPQVTPFFESGVFGERTRIFEVAAASCRFQPGDQDDARTVTGLYGDPCLLWVGRLDENKDPITVIDAVRRAAGRLPDVQLWMCYTDAPQLSEVQARLGADPELAQRVHLLGTVPYEQLEALYQAADFKVLGSRNESTCFAVVEALACGLPPVVTDIAAFRALTADGSTGRLFPCGDAQRMANALVEVHADDRAEQRARARAVFDRSLAFSAMGRRLLSAYEDVSAR